VVVRYDIWMAEALQEADLAENFQEIRMRFAHRNFFDGKMTWSIDIDIHDTVIGKQLHRVCSRSRHASQTIRSIP